jgi:hypothetical protein
VSAGRFEVIGPSGCLAVVGAESGKETWALEFAGVAAATIVVVGRLMYFQGRPQSQGSGLRGVC